MLDYNDRNMNVSNEINTPNNIHYFPRLTRGRLQSPGVTGGATGAGRALVFHCGAIVGRQPAQSSGARSACEPVQPYHCY